MACRSRRPGQTYSILTVGDGLVAQIPALFVSITAGTVVTRVAGGDADSLGGEIALQLGKDSRALWLAAAIALLIGCIPGFPTAIFAIIAVGLGLLGRAATRRQVAAVQDALPKQTVPPPPARVQVVLSAGLAAELTPARLHGAIARSAVALARELGIPMPAADIQEAVLPDRGFRIDLDGVPLADGEIPADSLLLRDDAENATLAGVAVELLDGRSPASRNRSGCRRATCAVGGERHGVHRTDGCPGAIHGRRAAATCRPDHGHPGNPGRSCSARRAQWGELVRGGAAQSCRCSAPPICSAGCSTRG